MNMFKHLVKSQKIMDMIGVVRGIVKVNGQIVKRAHLFPEDLQTFSKNLENEFNVIKKEFDDAVEFFEAAKNIYDKGNVNQDDNFVTFKSHNYNYEKNKEVNNKLEDNVENEPQAQAKSNEAIESTFNFEEYQKQLGNTLSGAIEKKVPTSSISRAFEFTKVGSSILGSSVGSYLKSSVGFGDPNASGFKDMVLSEQNAERLSNTLCKMRGAALKLGQAISMQEDALLPPQIKKAFEKARQSANIMPTWQLKQILVDTFGTDWENHFQDFNLKPFAAASIGQVHFATMKDGKKVALKIQYPGVSASIDSDINNLKRIMKYTGIFPKGMFVEQFLKNTRAELIEECDYIVESEKQMK